MRIRLEQCGSKYVHKHYLEALRRDLLWLNSQDNIEQNNWEEPDGVELTEYIRLFRKFISSLIHRSCWSGRYVEQVLDCVYAFRQCAIHGSNISKDELATAMKWPEMLDDIVITTELEDFKSWVDSVSPSQSLMRARRAFSHVAFPTVGSYISTHRLLEMIQLIVSKTVFGYVAREDPALLERKGWKFFEQVELIQWYYHADWSDALGDLRLRDMVKIRNVAIHRNVTYKDELQQFVQNAITFALQCKDPVQAVEIEIYAEQYFTKRSRQEVLERLQGVYMNDDPTKFDEGRIIDRQRTITSMLTAGEELPSTETSGGKQADCYQPFQLLKPVSPLLALEASNTTFKGKEPIRADNFSININANGHIDDAPGNAARLSPSLIDDEDNYVADSSTPPKPTWPASMHTELTEIEVWVNPPPSSSEDFEEWKAQNARQMVVTQSTTQEELDENRAAEVEDCSDSSKGDGPNHTPALSDIVEEDECGEDEQEDDINEEEHEGREEMHGSDSSHASSSWASIDISDLEVGAVGDWYDGAEGHVPAVEGTWSSTSDASEVIW